MQAKIVPLNDVSYVGATLAFLLLLTLAPAVRASEPVPAKADRDAAQKEMTELFSLDEADTPLKKATLATKLMKVADETEDATPRFALLNLARELAADSAQVRMSFEVIDQMQKDFDFDANSLRLLTLGDAVKANVPATEKREVVLVGMEVVDERIANDDYATAVSLVKSLQHVARLVRDNALIDELAERRTQVEEFQRQYVNVEVALKTLEADPDDPEANLLAGKFFLLAKRDWTRSMPMLILGSDPKLAEAGQIEIIGANTPEEKKDLADVWWEIAESEVDEHAKSFYRTRSLELYREIADDLSGLERARVKRRIESMSQSSVRARPVPVPKNILDTVDVTKHTSGTVWSRAGTSLRIVGSGTVMIPVTLHTDAYEVSVLLQRQAIEWIKVVLPVQDRYVSAILNDVYKAGRPTKAGFERISGRTLWQNATRQTGHKTINDGRMHRVTCRVAVENAEARLQLVLDNKLISEWQGPIAELTPEGPRPDAPRHLMLEVSTGDTYFHAVGVDVKQGMISVDANE